MTYTTLSFDLCSEIRKLFPIFQVPLKKYLQTRTSGHCSISPWQKHDWYDLNRPDFVEKFWKKITPDHPVSEALIALKKNRLGPFASTDAAVFVSVPVPSSIHKGEAIVRAGSSFEANWIRLSNDDLQSPIWVHATHLHDRDPILEKTTGLKHELIQLNLEDAKSLFGKARFAGPLQLAQASF
jgi:hypothetical protein